MNQHLVISLIGPDHPGLINQLSQILAQHQANWLESRFSHLKGQFAGMLSTQLMADQRPALQQALEDFAKARKMTLLCHTSEQPEQSEALSLAIEVVGTDRLGIIHDVTQVLYRHQTNVESIDSETVEAPMSSEPLFTAMIEVSAPQTLSLETLLEDLEAMDDSLEFELFTLADKAAEATQTEAASEPA